MTAADGVDMADDIGENQMDEQKREWLKKEILTIPNLMSFFRLVLIPVFAWVYLTAETAGQCYLAVGILAVSSLTDMFDGLIARKFHMISKLGKVLDPVADKATHIVLMLCLCSRYKGMWVLVGIFVVKEGFMAVMGIINLRKGKMLDGAKWYGKVCTAMLFAAMLILVAFPEISSRAANAILIVCGVLMIATLLLYIPVFRKMKEEKK